jgi:DnaA family protein
VQLPLDIKWNESASLQSFVAGENAQAVRWVGEAAEGGARWPALFLHGAASIGKSHLLQGACKRVTANGRTAAYLPLQQLVGYGEGLLEGFDQAFLVAVDDLDVLEVEPAMQRAVFHLFNRAVDNGCSLLFAARRPPAKLVLELADLRSRLGWGMVLAMQQPDDETLLRILRHRASLRGLELSQATARYLIRRMPRRMDQLLEVFDSLDQASLVSGRRLTIPFVRECLSAQGVLGTG